MSRRIQLATVLTLIGLAFSLPAGSVIPAGFSDVVLFATSSINIKMNVTVHSGSVIVNQAQGASRPAFPTEEPSLESMPPVGLELDVDKDGSFPAGFALKADSIRLKGGNVVGGDVHYNELNNSGKIQGSEITPLALPVFPALPPFKTGPGDGSDVTVGNGGVLDLDEGTYGSIAVGQGATLRLTGGFYSVRSIEAGKNSRVEFSAFTELAVTETVYVDQDSYVGPQGGSGLPASDIAIYVAGGSAEAIWFRKQATVAASLYAPNGILRFDKSAAATGAFLAHDIQVEKDCQFTLETFFFNRPPDAGDDLVIVGEGEDVNEVDNGSISLLSNDSDFDGDNLTMSTTPVSDPDFGTLTLNADGTFLYDHDGSETLADGFVYEVCDDGVEPGPLCSEGTVTIEIIPANDPPVTGPDNIVTPENTPVTFNPLLNDSDVDGNIDPTTVSIPDDRGVNGTISVNPVTGEITYTPVTDSTIGEGFQYQVCDDGTPLPPACSLGAVTISINDENNPPAAIGAEVNTDGVAPLTIVLTGQDIESDDLIFSIVGGSGPTEGTLGPVIQDPPPFPGDPPGCNPLNDPECIPGDPPRTSATVVYTAFLADNLPDSFDFLVDDQNGGTATATIAINPDGTPEPGEVDAFDTAEDTDLETPVTVGLTGDAPTGVTLTFSIIGGPSNGSLGPVNPLSDVAATVVYTPDAGFEGVDSFQFEACGIIDTVEVCATATATINVSAPDSGDPPPDEPPTADDQNLVTGMEEPIAITLSGSGGSENPQAPLINGRPVPDPRIDEGTTEITASIGGNTADCFPLNGAEDASVGDGFGDNHNDNLPAVPKFVSAARNGSLASGNGSKGDARIHIEFDIDSLAGLEIQSAEVKLTTHLGSVDSLDTDFFWIQAEGNGLLEDSDFEAGPAVPIPGSTLPVSVGNGTHTFDVTDELRQALLSELIYFTVQGRVDEGPANNARGLEVYSTCTCSAVSEWPQLIITTFEGVMLTYQVVSLPELGTLTDSNGAPVVANVDLPGPDLTYTPDPGISGVDSFDFKVTDEFGQMAFATVTITIIDANGCEDCYTLELVLQGTGVGDVTSNPNGIFCPGTCVAEFPQGSNVVLQARPIENGTFGGYGGDCSGSGPLLTVLMNGDKVCTATINAAP